MLTPLGFERRKSNWVYQNDELCKLINLQKSDYSNLFYINYGYIIKGLELTTTRMHVENRLASKDKQEQKCITDLLDLDIEIPIQERCTKLKNLIHDIIIENMLIVNTSEDLFLELKKRPHLNDIPLVIKKYYGIKDV